MQSEWRYRNGILWMAVVAAASLVACGTDDETLPNDSSGPDAAIVIPGVDAGGGDVERAPDVPAAEVGADEQGEPGEWEGEGSVPMPPLVPTEPVEPPAPVDAAPPWVPGTCVDVDVLCTVRGGRGLRDRELDADVLSTIDCEAVVRGVDLPDSGVEYVWDVELPSTSASSLSVTDQREVSLFLSAVGTYRVLVEVMIGEQVVNCETASAQVVAQPGEDIYVEMTWTTPGDPDPDDTGPGTGADVDLHMLRNVSGACWGDIPEDCHWRNRAPDWGVVGGAEDNCSLDIDDDDGWGPESAALNRPQNVMYSIGVHYFKDWDFGESTVQVNVYIFGILVYEAERTLNAEQEFWHVADIDWATQSVIEVDELYATEGSAECGE